MKITFQGNPLNTEGSFPTVGSKLKNFTLLANDLSEKKSADYNGKVLVILTVPSLDTGVCDMEVRKFNTEATSLSGDVQIIAVSMDLPFAQGRWCAASGVKNVATLSDHRTAAFGKDYGVFIKELCLLTRSVLVYNKNGELVYTEFLDEITNEPNYAAALEAVKNSCK